MLYIILLLILAVLLFGSGAVIGFLGYVLGFIVAAIALFWLSITYQIDPVVAIMIGIVGFFALCGLVMLIASLIEPWELERMKRKAAEKPFRGTGLPGNISPSEREAIRSAAASKHYAKKRRKGRT